MGTTGAFIGHLNNEKDLQIIDEQGQLIMRQDHIKKSAFDCDSEAQNYDSSSRSTGRNIYKNYEVTVYLLCCFFVGLFPFIIFLNNATGRELERIGGNAILIPVVSLAGLSLVFIIYYY